MVLMMLPYLKLVPCRADRAATAFLEISCWEHEEGRDEPKERVWLVPQGNRLPQLVSLGLGVLGGWRRSQGFSLACQGPFHGAGGRLLLL